MNYQKSVLMVHLQEVVTLHVLLALQVTAALIRLVSQLLVQLVQCRPQVHRYVFLVLMVPVALH
jgi:hypothetical protein